MPRRTDRGDDIVSQATALAWTIAPEIGSIVLTHYPDPDTLDLLRPGEGDLPAVTAVNRAVAVELAAQGVEVFVQVADRAAFRRWMDGRDDTPENRRRWIDRGRLLRGAAAFRVLGLPPRPVAPPPRFAKAPGPIADRLLAAFDDQDEAVFDELAQALLGVGRDDVFDLTVRKMAAQHGDEAAGELEAALLMAAEGGWMGPSGWAELVALPVALPQQSVPNADVITASFLAAGLFEEAFEFRFLPGWRSAEAFDALSPRALRRVLRDCLAGTEPRDLPPGDTDALARHGFGVLLGVQLDWGIPTWEEIAALGAAPQRTDDEAEQPRQSALFDRWRAATFDSSGGCVPLALVSPSEVAAEIAAFLDEAGEHAGSIEDIRQFIAVARGEAGGEDIVGRAEILGGGLELSLQTVTGRFLDRFTLPADRMPAAPEDVLRLVESLVRVVK